MHSKKKSNVPTPEWRVIIDMLSIVDKALLNRILRRMIYYLYSLEVKGISELVERVDPDKKADKKENDGSELYSNMPNPKMNTKTLRKFAEKVFQIAGENIIDKDISSQIKIWMAQEKSRFLSLAFENQNISLSEAKDVLNRFMKIPKGETYISPDDFVNIRVLLIRRFLSSNLNYINIAKYFITVRDFHFILKKVIGLSKSLGKLGGKSSGLILAHEILRSEKKNHPELNDIKVPNSWYITSDTIMDFIHINTLEEITSLKYLDTEQVRAGYPFLQQVFKNSAFPQEFIDQLKNFLSDLGNKPLIVRSSSLLEDSFDATFSGKYKSLFLANRGSLEEKLNNLLDAIAEIFSSIFGPDPIEYRKEKGLIDFQEEMGILVQEVVGSDVGKYYFPTFSGVAFSRNEFRWSPRIGRDDGIVRIVAGLGTRSVDRIGDDYPFLASPGKPGISVNVSYDEIIKYSQKKMDVLNLEKNIFETVETDTILKQYIDNIPGIEKLISFDNNGELIDPIGMIFDSRGKEAVLTFNNLAKKGKFLSQINTILSVLKKAFNSPVDVEFACDGENLYILQCRPQISSGDDSETFTIPSLEKSKIIFKGSKYITSGKAENIRYLVFVDPKKYSSLKTEDEMKNVAAIISQINRKLKKKDFILIGPGRWGSRGDIRLGVPVTYSDIFNTAMLIEISEESDGYRPELSFGTHFFQDLVESNIKYLPLYLYEEGTFLNTKIIFKAKNILNQIVNETTDLEDVVRVIDIDTIINGSRLNIVMNGDEKTAIGFLSE